MTVKHLISATALAVFLCPNLINARVTGDPVTVTGGQIEGVWDRNAAVRAYLGVPFAAPPIGDLRWKAPAPVAAWDGVRHTNHQPPICMQTLRTPGTISIEVYGNENLPMSEDCLYLNVWAPANIPQDETLPVLFWIHGGAFTSGSAAKPEFDGAALAEKGIIVVSINYRLNIFGFFAHPDLINGSDKGAGNFGMLDQVAALQWTQDNIKAFGGDPARVTIAGQSAGGMSVSTLMASPLTKGLFSGAIAQSAGVPVEAGTPLEKVAGNGKKFTDKIGGPSISELRDMPADVLLAIASDARARFAGPVIDGYFLPRGINEVWEAGEQAQVPLLLGWSANEFQENTYDRTIAGLEAAVTEELGADQVEAFKAVYGVTDDASATEARQAFMRDGFFGLNTWNGAELQAKSGQPTYLYYWSHESPFWQGQSFQENTPATLLGAYHGSQVPYVFGTLDLLDREFQQVDRDLSDLWQSYTINFVQTGNPNGQALPDWPEFQDDQSKVFNIDGEIKMIDLPHRDQMEYFRKIKDN